MSHKIPCEVIQDLMPLYVDELISKTTKDEIESHLNDCEKCKTYHEQITVEIVDESQKMLKETEKEINYLKKIKKNANHKIVIGALSAIVLMIVIVIIKLYIIGYPVDVYALNYLNVNNEEIRLGGVFEDNNSYKNYKIRTTQLGEKELIIYGQKTSFWSKTPAFNIKIKLDEIYPQIDINGNTVNSEGYIISKLANDLYKVKNPYIGDAVANGKIAEILGISKNLGPFTNQLQTQKEPYEWILKFENPVKNTQKFDEEMQNYAYTLMALIDNLGEVSWTYKVETEDGLIINKQTKNQRQWGNLNRSIKTFSETPQEIQLLLDVLEIK